MNETLKSITDPDLDMNEAGVVILSRGGVALVKSACRAKIQEVSGRLASYNPLPHTPHQDIHLKYSAKAEQEKILLHQLGEVLRQLEAWVALTRLSPSEERKKVK